jgi:predicted nucleotidyltransferase
MNLTGVRLLFEESAAVTIAEDVEVLLPSVPVVTLLKMIAYLDHHERTSKDLVHLATIFDDFPSDDDDRMFTVEQSGAGLSPNEARIQVLSRELAAIIDEHERADCARFVDLMRTDTAHAARFMREMTQPKDDREQPAPS